MSERVENTDRSIGRRRRNGEFRTRKTRGNRIFNVYDRRYERS